MPKTKKIAITIGDPAGIGPEIIVKTLNLLNPKAEEFVLIGNKDIFARTAEAIKLPLNRHIEIIDIPCDLSQVQVGKPAVESGKQSFQALEGACGLAQEKEISAIVTAPISKKAIDMAGYHYSGQTEILQKYLGKTEDKPEIKERKLPVISSPPLHTQAEMLFVAGDLRVMLLTRHIKLADVSGALSTDRIVDSIYALNAALINEFKINVPRIAMCALNPHAGEDGLIGKEEKEIIIPALIKLREEYGVIVDEPRPADTLWRKASVPYLNNQKQPYDAYIACYHDQGLIPVKMLAMDTTVNVTINLPIIRTSPSHGTAYDIAGKNLANPASMRSSVELALQLAR